MVQDRAFKVDAVARVEHILGGLCGHPQRAGDDVAALRPLVGCQHRLLLLFPAEHHFVHLNAAFGVGRQQIILVARARHHPVLAGPHQGHLVPFLLFFKEHRDFFPQCVAQFPKHINGGHGGIALDLADHPRADPGLFRQHCNAHALFFAELLEFCAKINVHSIPFVLCPKGFPHGCRSKCI